jgi:hypothetical protein
MLLEAVRQGTFEFDRVTARYAQNGTTYEQPVAQGVRFTVAQGAFPRQVSDLENPCLAGTSVLPTGT